MKFTTGGPREPWHRLLAMLVFMAPITSSAAPNPLAPLVPVFKKLEQGVTAVIGGAAVEKAFAPLAAVPRKEPALRQDLTAAGARTAKLLAMEFELILRQGDRAVYYLRTNVNAGRQRPVFLEVKGRVPDQGKLFVRGEPLSSFRAPLARPMATAASALVSSLRGKGCTSLPLAILADLPFELPAKLAARAQKDLSRAPRRLEQVCKEVAGLKHTSVELRVDDVTFAALDGKGQMVGMIKGELEWRAKALVFQLGQFRKNRD